MNLLHAPDFDLRLTLESGQIFRYRAEGSGFLVNARDRFFFVEQRGERLLYDGTDGDFLVRTFRLDEDQGAILRALEFDPVVREAARRFRGLRVVRQDPWECLATFICSSVSNIPKIRMNVEAIAAAFGREVRLGPHYSFTFPEPGEIDDPDRLRDAKVGFRGAYLLAASRRATRPWLESLRALPLAEARRELMSLPGVAEKIADCVLLFSLGFTDAFPVDVWIHRIVQRAYFGGRRVPLARVREWAARRFGPLAGYAEAFLYVGARQRGRDEPARRGVRRGARGRGGLTPSSRAR